MELSTVLSLVVLFVSSYGVQIRAVEPLYKHRNTDNTSVQTTRQHRNSRSPPGGLGFDPSGEVTSDQDWERLKCRGINLLYMLSSDDSQAGQYLTPPQASVASSWINFPADYAAWGYSHTQLPDQQCVAEIRGYGLSPMLGSLGMSEWDFHCFQVEHGVSPVKPGDPSLNEQSYTGPDGRVRRATGAIHVVAINAVARTIIFIERFSPAHRAGERVPPVPEDQLPHLKLASDITWGLWLMHGQGFPIRYLINFCVTNEVTISAIRRALVSRARDLDAWPGQSFSLDEDEGLALLGTPNGKATGFFVVQHKQWMGDLELREINVFQGNGWLGAEPNMLFAFE